MRSYELYISIIAVYQILHLESLGDKQTEDDRASIADLRQCLHSQKVSGKERGTLLTMLASMTAEQSAGTSSRLSLTCDCGRPNLMFWPELVRYPKQSRVVNLQAEDLYGAVFSHLRHEWEGQFSLVTETAPLDTPGSRFTATHVRSYAYVTVAGVRYGAAAAHRGRNYRYAYINGRDAVQIERLLRVSHISPTNQEIHAHLAVVRPFLGTDLAARMPWIHQLFSSLLFDPLTR